MDRRFDQVSSSLGRAATCFRGRDEPDREEDESRQTADARRDREHRNLIAPSRTEKVRLFHDELEKESGRENKKSGQEHDDPGQMPVPIRGPST